MSFDKRLSNYGEYVDVFTSNRSVKPTSEALKLLSETFDSNKEFPHGSELKLNNLSHDIIKADQQKPKNKTKALERINEQLTDLNLLIILLSHTDKDHINWVTNIDCIEGNKDKTISFLCGDWDAKNSKESNQTKAFLEKNTIMHEPYKWGNEEFPHLNPKFFSGNFVELLEQPITQLKNKIELCKKNININEEKIKEENKNSSFFSRISRSSTRLIHDTFVGSDDHNNIRKYESEIQVNKNFGQ